MCVCFVGRLLALCTVSAAGRGIALRGRQLAVPCGQRRNQIGSLWKRRQHVATKRGNSRHCTARCHSPEHTIGTALHGATARNTQ